jgi:geranylgeranyl diphosphate synthase, type II
MYEHYRILVQMIQAEVIRSLKQHPLKNEVCLEAALHIASAPSHLWRPLLCIKVWHALTRESHQRILPIACSAELIHVASMILDDLPCMDNAKIRRAKPACHILFGEGIAALSSFWLMDVAQHLVHKADFPKPRLDVLENKLRAAKDFMIKGQMVDLEAVNPSVEQVIEMYRCKSGALYAYALTAPAIALGREEAVSLLTELGESVGIAYQMADDIFDVEGDKNVLGKEVGMDAGKPTLPRLIGLERTRQRKNELKARCFEICRQLFGPESEVEQLVNKVIV